MGEPAFNLPEDDQPAIRPDLPGLRALEGGGQGDGVPSGKLRSAKDNDDDSGDDSKGFFNREGDNKTVGSGGLAAAEAGVGLAAQQLGKGFTGGASSKAEAVKNLLWSTKNRRRNTIGGGLVGTIVSIAFAVAGITSGPLQAIHLSQILMKNFRGSENSSSVRANGLFRFARTNDVGETRVGKLGSLTFAKTTAQLKDIGIEFQRNPYTGNPKSMTVDTAKFTEKYPELKGMSSAEKISFLEAKFNIAPGELRQISGLKGGKFAVSTRGYGIQATRELTSNVLQNLDNGKIVTAIKNRSMADFFNTPSLWHPLKRVLANKENKLGDVLARRAVEEKRLRASKPVPSEEAIKAETKLKDAFKSTQGKIGGALLITGAMCLVRSVADDVVTVNRAAIVVPAAIQATDKIAIGAQAQSGQDISMEAVGGVVETFTDKEGNSIWSAQALSATAQPDNAKGVDITPDYKQAFSKDTTAANIKETLGGGNLGDAACSPVGQVIQLSAGAALILAGPFTDGASWGALVVIKGAQLTATAGVLYMVENQLTNLFSSDTIIPSVLSGPIGGNLLAYGAREGANIDARASGGVALSKTDATILYKQQQLEDTKDFQSKSFFARAFDVHDYRSLASRAIDTQNPNPAQNIKTMAIGLLSVNKWMTTISSVFSPLARAASQPYDWGFPEYGIPSSLLNDPNYEDPYDNADKVAGVLDKEVADSLPNYIPKAKTCFGVIISKGADGWNAVASGDVNSNSGEYLAANCSDMSDDSWKRIMLFTFDTRTMEAVACYEGADQACTNVGFGTATPAPTTATAPNTGSAIVGDIGLSSDTIACATNTKDLGITTSQYAGARKRQAEPIKMRLCQLSSISGIGQDTKGSRTSGGAVVNSRVSGAWQTLGEKAKTEKLNLNSSSSFRLGDSCGGNGNGLSCAAQNGSMHQLAVAIDFSGPTAINESSQSCSVRQRNPGEPTWDWLNKNAASFGFKQYSAEAWHWDALVAVNRCGGDGS